MRRRAVQASVTVLGLAAALLVGASSSAATNAPVLAIGRACPGFSTTVTGTGFADGNYTLQTTAGTLSVTQVTASGGVLRPAPTLRLPTNAPHNFFISATAQANGGVGTRLDTALSDPAFDRQDGFPAMVFKADCFAPGEHVSVVDSPTVSSPASVVADAKGSVLVTFHFHPTPQETYPSAMLTGQTSRQFGSLDLYPLPATTLFAGQSISDWSDPNALASASDNYELFPGGGILYLNNSVTGATSWAVGGDPKSQNGSRLVMETDGNLVLFSGAGKVVWNSSTRNSGAANRVILQNDGNLIMYTSAGRPIWSSAAGVIGAPNNLHSYAYGVGTRPYVFVYPPPAVPRNPPVPVQPVPPRWVPGTAVYINGLIKQAIPTGALARGAHRIVYLQRYVSGHWQNMLARTTDSIGQLAVGFIQPRPQIYRLVVLRTSTASAATSAAFVC